MRHTFPALHNAMWPGLVGKGGPDAEPPIDLDTMLNLTAAAHVNRTRFDGVELLEAVDRPGVVGFQADMAHTLLFTMGSNAPDDRILPENFDWSNRNALDDGLRETTRALRPWTIDFHVAQNDATVKGSGTHDKTGRHCLPYDPTESSTSCVTLASGSATIRDAHGWN